MPSKKSLLSFILPLLFFHGIQEAARGQNMEYGLYGGISYYLGDLNPGKPFSEVHPAFGLIGRYNFDSRWAVKLSAFRGKVSGNSGKSTYLPDRMLVFESPVTDISAVAEFNFFKYITGSRRNFITPYIYGGIGVFFFNPSANGQELQALGTEGQNIGYEGRKKYALVGVNLPFGLGMKLSISKKIGLTLFWEMHKTFTDYLDDVSSTYYLDGYTINPDIPEEFQSDPAQNHQPGMQRGNSRTQDWYSFSGVTIIYKFNLPGSKKCKDLKEN